MKLDRWVILGNVLVGYVYDGPFPRGTRVMTEAIRFVNPVSMEAECLDGKYKLLDPGTMAEHNQELIGTKKPEASLPRLENVIFLNPRG